MNKIWIVYDGTDYYVDVVLKVFASEEQAKAFLEKCEKEQPNGRRIFFIQDYEVEGTDD